MSDNGGRKTIRYNVGGQIFEVSHDVVNRHPTTILAERAAEFSLSSSADDIFIDGNAERFGYVLDYLRTGRAVLPSNIPKSALLRDLKIYGFKNVDPNHINAINASADAVLQVTKLQEYYKQVSKERDADIAALQLKRRWSSVANECFRQYIQNAISGSVRLQWNTGGDVYVCFSNLDVGLLNEMLEIYGLNYISHEVKLEYGTQYVFVKLGMLPNSMTTEKDITT